MEPLKICYLLESTHLSGGVRVVFDQVRALHALGHEVKVRALFGDHRWYSYPVDVDYVRDLTEDADNMELDVAIGTFWTTVESAMRLPARLVVHLCQGCEFDCTEFSQFKEDIEAVYAHTVPKLTVGEWLCERIWSRFGKDLFPVFCVGQIVDTDMHHPPGWLKNLRKSFSNGLARILGVGTYECGFKGIPIALDAVEQIRREGFKLDLTRVSPLPLSREERAHTVIDAYHERISPLKMAEVYREADIFLAPSTIAEGFGLPFAEAIASGLPAVATRIPSFLSLGKPHDYAYFVPEGDVQAMANGLRRLLTDKRLRRRLSRRGARVVQGNLSGAAVAKKLEVYFRRMLNSNSS